jgi:putative spermidine/putrescine transport system substrate-binding protein
MGLVDDRLKRREFMVRGARWGGGLMLSAAAADLLAACGSSTATPASDQQLLSGSGPIALDTLKAKAKAEGGVLNATGIPPEWANYADILTGMQKNFSVNVDYKAQAEYTSAQEIEAITSTKNGQGFVPDIGDVGPQFGPIAIQQQLVVPYKHAHWADIPDNLKESTGLWCAEYYGAQAMVVNTNVVKNVPQDWSDLQKPEYKLKVGLDNPPTQANDALMSVWSASLASGGSLNDIGPGIDFFKKLKANGNFTPARANEANLKTGEVGIGLMWDYLGLGFKEKFAGSPGIQVIIPPSGSLAGYYISLVTKFAKHPFTARLWNEYIFSDEGQLDYLKGFAHPMRFQALVAAGKVPAALQAKLPSSAQYKNVKFPTADQSKAANVKIQANW